MRRKGCLVAFDVKLWKVRRLGWGKGRKKILATGLAFSSRSFVMSLGYFDFEFVGSSFFFAPFFFSPPAFL